MGYLDTYDHVPDCPCCCLGLMQQMHDELLRFSHGRLKICIYHGKARRVLTPKVRRVCTYDAIPVVASYRTYKQVLASHDVVISTVDSVRHELDPLSVKKTSMQFYKMTMRGRDLPDCLQETWYTELKLKGSLHRTKRLRVVIE